MSEPTYSTQEAEFDKYIASTAIDKLRRTIERIDAAIESCMEWDPECWIDVEPHLTEARRVAEMILARREQEKIAPAPPGRGAH